MEVEIKDIELFKKLMDTIGSLMQDVSLDFNEDGFAVKAMDPANIAMILFDGKKGLFSKFEVDKPTKISVSLIDLNGILKFVRRDDKLKLIESKGKLRLEVLGRNKMNFVIPLIDENYTAQKIPQLNFTAEAALLSSVLKDALKVALTVDDSVSFTVDGHKLSLSAKSEEKEFLEELNLNENKELFNLKSEGLTKSKFSIEYLSKFFVAIDPEKQVKLSMSNNYPLRVDHEMNDDAKIALVLANRLE